MILIVVGIGPTLFAFASGGISNYSSNFSNLMGNAGSQVAENLIIEQVVFVNTGNPATSGANLYVRDVGVTPSTVEAVYVQNSTANSFVEQFASSPLPVVVNSGVFQIISVRNFVPDHGIAYGFTIATSLGNTVMSNAKYY